MTCHVARQVSLSKIIISYMKGILVIMVCLAIHSGFAQTTAPQKDCLKMIDTLTNSEVYMMVEVTASPVGGMDKLYSYIIQSLTLPSGFQPTESKVIIAFVVGSNGEVNGARTLRSIKGTELDSQFK